MEEKLEKNIYVGIRVILLYSISLMFNMLELIQHCKSTLLQ